MAVSNNYCIYHLHSDLSNAVTNIDSVTKFKEYIDRAKECGMKAMAFSEHGSVMEWWHKKCAIEEAGMKYIHAVEAYLTEDLTEKIRDNYHCVLIADTWGIHNTGAILTSHLNPHQMKILACLAYRVVFALDKDVEVREDHNIKRLKQFVKVEYTWDMENLLDEKDSPVDKGIEVWEKLYEGRLSWR